MKRRMLSLVLMILLLTPLLRVGICADQTIYRSVNTGGMKIALTFDDGPHPHLTHEILSILDEYGVKATFFMVGVNVRAYPDAAREVIAAGHEVGNHTYSHPLLPRLCRDQLACEIEACEDVLEELCEYRPHLFRPPQGVLNEAVEACSESGDYSLILWSLDTRDWECKNTEQIVGTVLSSVRAGDIVLMHDYIGTHSKTPEALRILLPRLLEMGFELTTVSELLGKG